MDQKHSHNRPRTLRSAPTAAARSVLLMTNMSLCVMPGPPFLGTLSPPEAHSQRRVVVWNGYIQGQTDVIGYVCLLVR